MTSLAARSVVLSAELSAGVPLAMWRPCVVLQGDDSEVGARESWAGPEGGGRIPASGQPGPTRFSDQGQPGGSHRMFDPSHHVEHRKGPGGQMDSSFHVFLRACSCGHRPSVAPGRSHHSGSRVEGQHPDFHRSRGRSRVRKLDNSSLGRPWANAPHYPHLSDSSAIPCGGHCVSCAIVAIREREHHIRALGAAIRMCLERRLITLHHSRRILPRSADLGWQATWSPTGVNRSAEFQCRLAPDTMSLPLRNPAPSRSPLVEHVEACIRTRVRASGVK